MADQDSFAEALCSHLDLTEDEFEDYVEPIVRYRDKFIAHLDEERVANIPKLRTALVSAAFLYDYLRNDPSTQRHLHDSSSSAHQLYKTYYRDAYREYRRFI